MRKVAKVVTNIEEAISIAKDNMKKSKDIEDINYFKGVIAGLEVSLDFVEPYADYMKMKSKLKVKNNYENLVPKTQQITHKDVEKIKELKANGLSYSAIKAETNWSKATISRVLNGLYDND